MICAPRAANVNATDFFAWILWGTRLLGVAQRLAPIRSSFLHIWAILELNVLLLERDGVVE